MIGIFFKKELRENPVFRQLGITEEIWILIGKIISGPMQELNITGTGSNSFLRS